MKKILLSFAVFFALTTNAQILDCSDLFISEYVEPTGAFGSSCKYIEVHNPTDSPISLDDYQIWYAEYAISKVSKSRSSRT